MNKRKNKIILITISIVAVAAVVVTASIIRNSSVVGGLTVNTSTSKPSNSRAVNQGCLISPQEIEQSLLDEYPGLTSSRVKEVDTKNIERFLKSNPYVESAQAAISVGGRLIVNVVARRPIVRVYYGGKVFFIDYNGRCFPVRKSACGDVIVASGNFRQSLPTETDSLDLSYMAHDSLFSTYDLVSVWKLAMYLDANKDNYSMLFDQMFVVNNGDIILQPKFGNHEIVIGDTLDLDDKFRRLKTFYSKGMPHAGFDSYKRINLKYKEQVVCTKRNP